MFNTTLGDEAASLAGPFQFDVATADEILLNGVRCSFLPQDARRSLEEAFRREMDELKRVHLSDETAREGGPR